ncbi:MAG: polyhydroxyalkanoate synthesis repressor PhaR [Burkholderiaceae bacterium]|jgi:polyhydroxyalkanoate synthesis repressor PhaR|nr:polyhydroxyalkanoate synthesis repressor PhaR [Betaproteobacteria bacterium]
MGKQDQIRLIKKYPNRRLYDTRTSTYITLVDVKELVLANEDFQVIDAKTGDDLTRSILLQIILEEESAGIPMFSAEALANVIRFYGHAMQGMMGTYLEKNIQAFMDMQGKLQEQSQAFVGSKPGSQEAWTQFMAGQAPMMQNLMSNYIDQSKKVFMQMEEQMQNNAKSMLSSFGLNPDQKDKK